MKKNNKKNPNVIGWVFNGKFYNDINDLSGRTMYEGNTPIPVYGSKQSKN